MSEEVEDKDYDQLLEAAIGKFVVWFERVNMAIDETIHEIAFQIGVEEDREEFIDILLHDATANSMMNYFKGYIIHFFEDELESDKETNKHFCKLLEKMKEVIEFRNILLHSTLYFLANNDEGDLVYRWTAKRYGINKSGLHSKIDKANDDLFKLIKDKSNICWHLFYTIRNLPFVIIPEGHKLNYMFSKEQIEWMYRKDHG